MLEKILILHKIADRWNDLPRDTCFETEKKKHLGQKPDIFNRNILI